MLHAREFRKLTWQLYGSIRIQIQDPDFLSNPRSSFSNAERRPHDLSPVNSLIASFINPLVQSSINKMCLKHRLYVYFYIKNTLLSIIFKIFASSSSILSIHMPSFKVELFKIYYNNTYSWNYIFIKCMNMLRIIWKPFQKENS